MGRVRMSAAVLRPTRPTPLDDALARLRTLVSPYTGIVRRLEEPLTTPSEPRLVRIAAEIAADGALLGSSLRHLEDGTGGCAADRNAAIAAAIGEAAERYAGAYLPEEGFKTATARELGDTAVAPEKFALFATWQYEQRGFPFRPFTSETSVRWVRGFTLPAGEPADLPVQLVYLRDPRAGGDEPIGYATSSGLACGPTLEEATASALLEVLERDAFMLVWYGRLSLPRLDWSGHPLLTAFDERYFAPTRLRYEAVDLSTFFGVPTVLAVVRNREAGRSPLAVGAGCAPTVEEAWRKALCEAFAVRSWGNALREDEPDRSFRADFGDVRTFADHVLFFADPERARAGDFLDSSPEVRPIADVQPIAAPNVLALIEELCRRVEAVGEQAYGVDVTSPDIGAAGLRVAKVLAPGLCQLNVRHDARFLASPRLTHAAWQLGMRPEPLDPHDLNSAPHPFP